MSKRKRRGTDRPRPAGAGRPRSGSRSGQLTEPPGQRPAGNRSDGPDAALAQLQVIVGLITTGALDVHLGTLQAAISKRHQARVREASNQAAAQLRVGDRVALTEHIRPLYLKGATGTVTGWASHNAIVHLDEPRGRFDGAEIRCPPLGLRRLSA
ncbi:hypothetical protein [Occultella kanbiaonis]|uniref:hypothetical protein n=1 Tax=Occultella kanbiaonis TaxID=2675754 RepID=UPI0012B98A05|nr:hypothetical protein [Occultella kanbiaonis]